MGKLQVMLLGVCCFVVVVGMFFVITTPAARDSKNIVKATLFDYVDHADTRRCRPSQFGWRR